MLGPRTAPSQPIALSASNRQSPRGQLRRALFTSRPVHGGAPNRAACVVVLAAGRSGAPTMATKQGAKNAVFWFRKGLRLHDNPALLEAINGAQHLYPIFIIDPHFLKNSSYKVSVNRYNFLLESLHDLDASLKARGSRLLVLRGKPEEVLPRVFKDWQVSHLMFEVDTEPYAVARDKAVTTMAMEHGVVVKPSVSHTLYDTADLVKRAGGKPPLTMQSFTKLVDKVGPPPAPAPLPPTNLPPPAPGAKGAEPEATTVPTLQEVGYTDTPSTIFKGGETEALKRFEDYMKDPKWVAGFEKPNTDPSAFIRPATTVLSPYLKFGCLSARTFHARLLQIYAAHPKHSQPPVSLRGQLLWREFFYTVGAHTPNFDRMAGNAVCKQIPWDDQPEKLKAWAEARTGFPWIDACMTQLRQWGWMHHLARHSVACFLTRGDLYQSWEGGKAVFEELLIDQDHFLNAANWMWLSASAFFSQYFRVYSPISFGKKYDPDGKFIRHFLPVLKDFPSKYIYEPWTAPLEVQQRAKCIIGKDYPGPIVDHATASKACISRMAAAYRASKGEAADKGEEEEDEEEGGKGGAKKAGGKKAAGSSPAAAKGRAAKAAGGAAAAAAAADAALAGSGSGAAAGGRKVKTEAPEGEGAKGPKQSTIQKAFAAAKAATEGAQEVAAAAAGSPGEGEASGSKKQAKATAEAKEAAAAALKGGKAAGSKRQRTLFESGVSGGSGKKG